MTALKTLALRIRRAFGRWLWRGCERPISEIDEYEADELTRLRRAGL